MTDEHSKIDSAKETGEEPVVHIKRTITAEFNVPRRYYKEQGQDYTDDQIRDCEMKLAVDDEFAVLEQIISAMENSEESKATIDIGTVVTFK